MDDVTVRHLRTGRNAPARRIAALAVAGAALLGGCGAADGGTHASLVARAAAPATVAAASAAPAPAVAVTAAPEAAFTAAAAAPPSAGGPVPLVVTVAPTSVAGRVGRPVRISLTWSDGDGRLAGTTEDWGDLGTGSTSVMACDGPEPAHPDGGVIELQHTFAAPGTHQVRFTVTTTSCADGTPVNEDATVTAAVTVTR